MAYLSKLNPKVGGSLGGLPERVESDGGGGFFELVGLATKGEVFDAVNLNTAYDAAYNNDGVIFVVSNISDNVTSFRQNADGSLAMLDSYTSVNLNGAVSCAIDNGNNVLYVASNIADSLTAIDISDPENLSERGSYSNGTTMNGADYVELDLENSIAYVAAGTYLVSIDISNPDSLSPYQELNTVNGPVQYISLNADKTVAFVAAGTLGIKSYNVSNPASMTLLQTYDPSFNSIGVALYDDRDGTLYAGDVNDDYIAVVNANNPSNMLLQTTFSSFYTNQIFNLKIDKSRNLLFLTSSTGFSIADMSDPLNIESKAGIYSTNVRGIGFDENSKDVCVTNSINDSISTFRTRFFIEGGSQ